MILLNKHEILLCAKKDIIGSVVQTVLIYTVGMHKAFTKNDFSKLSRSIQGANDFLKIRK
jgi:hypothetical protein